MNHTANLFCALSLLALCAAPAGAGMALTCDPDAGTLSTGGAYASSVTWNGVQITAGAIAADGAREYRVHGNFVVGAGDTVFAAAGSAAGVRFIIGNNAILAGRINFSGGGSVGCAGGGPGGQGGTASTPSLTRAIGGSGGAGQTGGAGGAGGYGGSMFDIWDGYMFNGGHGVAGSMPTGGSWGTAGGYGPAGKPLGNPGGAGSPGGGGLNNAAVASGGGGGTPGTAGDCGGGGPLGDNPGWPPPWTYSLGRGGNTQFWSYGNGEGGYGGCSADDDGGDGQNGSPGSPGGNGGPGSGGTNAVAATALSGGTGGAGGGGGGSGGNGGAGGGGGSGGGGEGGQGGGGGVGDWFADGFPGGAGGKGGDAGRGGNGQNGTIGGHGVEGGAGGAGGGAIEVRALGKVVLDGEMLARGGSGTAGQEGWWGSGPDNSWEWGGLSQDGAVGQQGEPRQPGWPNEGGRGGSGDHWNPFGGWGSDGSNGGYTGSGVAGGGGGGGGGAGGRGGRGGAAGGWGLGGAGGMGGGGAGGTVKVYASVLSGAGTIDTSGGAGIQTGGDGRLVLGLNTTDLVPGTVALEGAQIIEMTQGGRHLGPRKVNPYIWGAQTETAYLPGLVDGADVFGLTTLSVAEPGLAGLFADAPEGAVGAMRLMDDGPVGLGQPWDGFDMLLLANLTDETLVAPVVGVGEKGYLMSLMQGGWARDPLFGGGGYGILQELPAQGVYAMLVPEGTTHFNLMANDCEFTYRETLDYAQSTYMLPEPATLALAALGGVGLLVGRKRR